MSLRYGIWGRVGDCIEFLTRVETREEMISFAQENKDDWEFIDYEWTKDNNDIEINTIASGGKILQE